MLRLRAARHRRVVVGVLGRRGSRAVGLEARQLWASGSDRAYLGTDSRIFEPLAGALLAVLIDLVPRAGGRSRASTGRWSSAGAAGLAWGFATLGGPSGATSAYAHGGAVVVGCEHGGGDRRRRDADAASPRARSPPPAVAYLGRLSYGIYLWHWPLRVWTGRQRLVGPHRPRQPAAGLRAHRRHGRAGAPRPTRFVESPVRYGPGREFLVPRRTLVVAARVLTALFLLIDQSVGRAATGRGARATTKTIVLVGDSVPQRLAPELSRAAAAGYVVISATRGAVRRPASRSSTRRQARGGPARRARPTCPAPGRGGRGVPAGARHLVEPLRARRPGRRPRPVRSAFGSPPTGLCSGRRSPRTAALTRRGAIVVAVQIERSGLGIATRCTPRRCGPFLRRLAHDTAAQDIWNSFLASHTTGRCARSASSRSSATTGQPLQRPPCARRPGEAGRNALRRRVRRAGRRPRAVIDRSLVAAGFGVLGRT